MIYHHFYSSLKETFNNYKITKNEIDESIYFEYKKIKTYKDQKYKEAEWFDEISSEFFNDLLDH